MPAHLASSHRRLQTALLAVLALVSLLSSPAETATPEARAQARTLLQEYREKPDDFSRRLEIVEAIVGLSRDLGVTLLDYLDSRWQIDGPAYEEAMMRAIESEAKKRKDSPVVRSQTKAARKILLDLLEQGDALGEEALREEGWPAMQHLRALYEVKPESVLRNDPSLAAQKRRLEALVEERAYCIEELLETDRPAIDLVALDRLAEDAAYLAGLTDAKARAVFRKNRPFESELDPEEAAGIRDLNFMRMLLDRPALLIDLRLCEAARGHSQDMREHGFFAHESPIRGKESPFDRARAAGTSASAENISRGDDTGAGANKGWFYSPGHLLNMFGTGHRRIGLGRAGEFWTQLFG